VPGEHGDDLRLVGAYTVHKIVGERFRRFNVKPPVA